MTATERTIMRLSNWLGRRLRKRSWGSTNSSCCGVVDVYETRRGGLDSPGTVEVTHEPASRPRIRSLVSIWVMLLAIPTGGSRLVGQALLTEGDTVRNGVVSTPPLRIGPGDLIELAVFDIPELSGKARVDEAGNISVMLLGIVHVGGLSTIEAEQEVQHRLVSGKFIGNPQVSILIDEYATQGITVLGEVKTSGIYPAVGGKSLYDVISLAGGLSPLAGNVVTITRRGGSAVEDVQLRDEDGKLSGGNAALHPGDQVVIQRADILYVLGDVGKPGGFLIDREPISVMDALALASGFNKTAAMGKAKLFRKIKGDVVEVNVSLKDIVGGKRPDIALQAGDVVYVPTSAAKALWQQSTNGLLGSLAAASIYSIAPRP